MIFWVFCVWCWASDFLSLCSREVIKCVFLLKTYFKTPVGKMLHVILRCCNTFWASFQGCQENELGCFFSVTSKHQERNHKQIFAAPQRHEFRNIARNCEHARHLGLREARKGLQIMKLKANKTHTSAIRTRVWEGRALLSC